MFSRLREPGGSFTLIAGAIACLRLNLVIAGILAVVGLACLWFGWSRSRADRYDLSKLFDSPPEEPHLDHIPRDEVSAPYCGWCDECYPPGTHRCRECGRELG
jgi:hypothetical protein